jgi:hypothetical protein
MKHNVKMSDGNTNAISYSLLFDIAMSILFVHCYHRRLKENPDIYIERDWNEKSSSVKNEQIW